MLSLEDLAEATRNDILDDRKQPYLWSDDQLLSFAKEAVSEACQRAPLIRRTQTISITTGVTDYELEPTTRQIIYAKKSSDSQDLTQVSQADLEINYGASWRRNTGKLKHYFRHGYDFFVYPVPVEDDALILFSSHLPDDSFNLAQDIAPDYHRGLMHFIAYKAYLLNDADTGQMQRSDNHWRMFERYFGFKHTARYDQFAQELPLYARLEGWRMA